MMLQRPSGENIVALFAGMALCGIGLVAGTINRADAGDTLAFAGGLIGAGASVWAAFAVAHATAQSQQREANALFRNIVKGVHDDIEWLTSVSQNQSVFFGSEVSARRIDGITSGIPQTVEFLQLERLGSKSGSIATLAAELRFRSALSSACPAFESANLYRNRRRLQGDMKNVEVNVNGKVLADLLRASQVALKAIG